MNQISFRYILYLRYKISCTYILYIRYKISCTNILHIICNIRYKIYILSGELDIFSIRSQTRWQCQINSLHAYNIWCTRTICTKNIYIIWKVAMSRWTVFIKHLCNNIWNPPGMSARQFPDVQVWWQVLESQLCSKRWTTRWGFRCVRKNLDTKILVRTSWSPSTAPFSDSTPTSRMWCNPESLSWWASTSSLTCSYQRWALNHILLCILSTSVWNWRYKID